MSAQQPRILVAGIGNIFLGDDAFGVEVARRLADRRLPESVRVTDFGIRGFDLAYALLDDYDASILIDAVQRGGEPGTLYVIEPDGEEPSDPAAATVETHNLHPEKVLSLVRALGGRPRHVSIVGCEPATFGPDENGWMGLSAPVAAAVGEAVSLVETFIQKLHNTESPAANEEKTPTSRTGRSTP